MRSLPSWPTVPRRSSAFYIFCLHCITPAPVLFSAVPHRSRACFVFSGSSPLPRMSCFQRSHTAPAHVSFLAGPHRSRACFVFSGPSPLTIEIACLFNMFLAVPITAYSRFSGPLTAHRSSSGALTAHHLCHSSLADQQLLLSLFCSAVLATAHAVPTRLTLFPIALKLLKHQLQRKKRHGGSAGTQAKAPSKP